MTFYANKEISRKSSPGDENEPLAALERTFFVSEVSRLLTKIAVSIRVIDDQMEKLAKSDEARSDMRQCAHEWSVMQFLSRN
jgi:hypothetical protein